ncbi:MAG: uroD [Caproiciproducens sp.]|jgi:hypothetical protein|nr:uroD [Caproiciproducens sp.]
MNDAKGLYQEHLTRLKTAVELGKPDRMPVALQATSVCANLLGVKLSDFVTNPVLNNETILKAVKLVGDVDAIAQHLLSPHVLSMATLSKVKIPGVELPDDNVWQVAEAELMKPEDYDTIINKGFNAFLHTEYYPKRLDNVMAKLGPIFGYMPQALMNTAAAGLVVTMPVATSVPFEMFSGGRSMAKFARDMFKIPEKVQAAMDVAMNDIIADVKKIAGMAKPFGIMNPLGRASGGFLSRKIQERFAFPYFKKLTEVIVEAGAVPMLHLDSNWERDLDFFRDLPKGKCVMQLDGFTNIFKAKEILGDHMCIQGDVPPALLTLGTPDEVYSYCTRLISEIGPSGFILASGCDVPANAKLENIKAMVSAATGK